MTYQLEQSGTFLAAAQMEYQNELARSSSLDTRLSISLPIVSAYFFMVIQNGDFSRAWTAVVRVPSVWPILWLIADIVSLFCALLAFVLMISAILSQARQTVDLTDWDSFSEPESERDYIEKLAMRYLNAMKRNLILNRTRALRHTFGWMFAAVSLFFFVVSTLITG